MRIEVLADDAAIAKRELWTSRQRNGHFSNSQIFGDPAREIQLDFYIATTENQCVRHSDPESYLRKPASVIIRLVAFLKAESFLERCRSNKNEDLGYVELTNNAVTWWQQCLELQ